MQNNIIEASDGCRQGPAVPPAAVGSVSEDDVSDPMSFHARRVIDSLRCACLLAFTGGSLDAFLYLNHRHVFAGVMTGNAVLCGIAAFNHAPGAVMHYVRPLVAYVCGIWLIAVFQRHVQRHSVRFALGIVILGLLALSFIPMHFHSETYIFLVVLFTGFLAGIARRVDTYSYNATVLTGSLRDATISLYHALNPVTRARNLEKSRDLWFVMFSLFAGAAAGGLLGRHIGNHALWLPVSILIIVLVMVLRAASKRGDL